MEGITHLGLTKSIPVDLKSPEVFLLPNEHVERGQGHLGSVLPGSASLGPGRLITEETLASAVKTRV